MLLEIVSYTYTEIIAVLWYMVKISKDINLLSNDPISENYLFAVILSYFIQFTKGVILTFFR